MTSALASRGRRVADRIGLARPGSRGSLLATYYHQATPATTYWRCALPAKYLPGRLHAAWESETVIDEKARTIEHRDLAGDTAIVQFPGDQGCAMQLMALQATGKKLFVEVDDYYLDRKDPLWHHRSGWGGKIGETAHTVEGHKWISTYADGVIVTTPELQKAYLEVNPNVYVCRNSIDPDDWPRLSKPDDGVFRIGWYASQSHDRDQELCRKSIAWASRQPNVEIVTIGLNPTGWQFSRRWIGWRDDFREHRPELYKLDVGIGPLTGTLMTKYRSDVKALEYSMAGALPILSGGLPVFDEWRDKEYARICNSESDWMKTIKWAVANRDEVRARALQAREYVLHERTMSTEIQKWKEAIGVA